MSLDALFQQILLTEQQLTEQTQKFKGVKVAIIRCNEKLKAATEKYERTLAELDQKAQQLSAMRLQHDLMKKCEDQMLKQIEDMLCQKSNFEDCLATIKKESEDEEENFLQEISRFNSDFSLRGNRQTVFESQTHTELLDLEREVESLCKEMELMRHRNSHMRTIQEEKAALHHELQILEKTVKDLDRQLSKAEAMTESLKAEILFVSQKPLTDNTCLRTTAGTRKDMSEGCAQKRAWTMSQFSNTRLRKELEMYKEEELVREALSSEIRFLQSKLDRGQGGERH